MKHQPKKNTAAEREYIRDLERCGPLEKVERGEARLLSVDEYPEPVRRFLARERKMLHLQLSEAAMRKLRQLHRATGIPIDELARRWVEQGLAREAG
jgi:hypothetical protein